MRVHSAQAATSLRGSKCKQVEIRPRYASALRRVRSVCIISAAEFLQLCVCVRVCVCACELV